MTLIELLIASALIVVLTATVVAIVQKSRTTVIQTVEPIEQKVPLLDQIGMACFYTDLDLCDRLLDRIQIKTKP